MEKAKLILGIDTEGMNRDLQNSGVDTSTDRIIEIGAVLWDWELQTPVKFFSELIDEPDRLPISREVAEITGITDTTLERYAHKGQSIHEVLERFNKLIDEADYLMAHNGTSYDIPMLSAMFKRYGMTMNSKTWIDSFTDIEFPSKIKSKSMAMLEHSHGFINPFPHRAVTDVLSMLKVATQYELERMIRLAESPMVTIMAELKAPNWKNKEEVDKFNVIKNKVAKSRFKWNPSQKIWYKDVHKVLLDEGKLNYDFEWCISSF